MLARGREVVWSLQHHQSKAYEELRLKISLFTGVNDVAPLLSISALTLLLVKTFASNGQSRPKFGESPGPYLDGVQHTRIALARSP
jgi:hypothetical protein